MNFTKEEIAELRETYLRDGVVCVRELIDGRWADRLRIAAERVVNAPERHGELGVTHGPMTVVRFCYLHIPEFREFIFKSRLGEVVARIVGAKQLRLYHDYLFAKQPGSEKEFIWHYDAPGYSFSGEQIPNLWLAMSEVTAENGRLDFLAGFPRVLLADPKFTVGAHPDYEAVKAEYPQDIREVSWNLAPGDAVIFHPLMPHHSSANTSAKWRVGYAVRALGDDVRWDTSRPHLFMPIPGVDKGRDIKHGAPVQDHSSLPMIWRDDAAATQ